MLFPQDQLEQRATQFRAVQRRLLTKYKDKTLTPLTNLDNLLEGTYKQILQLTEAINSNLRVSILLQDTSKFGFCSFFSELDES